MEGSKPLGRRTADSSKKLHFEVSAGLKRVLGRELITDDEVAILEMVKNSFDAGASRVSLVFTGDSIVIADNGSGMSYEDLNDRWLFVAYSAKRAENSERDFRDIAAERGHFAGSKGIGRFSSDRLGQQLFLQTRPKGRAKTIHTLMIDWARFEKSAKEHFEKVPVTYEPALAFAVPREAQKFAERLSHGTIIEIKNLRQPWDREKLLDLKASLAKLINPFGDRADRFTISITAPDEIDGDKLEKAKAADRGLEVAGRNVVNGRVGNFIFSALKDKTTSIEITMDGGYIHTSLTDRGELIYKIREPNPFNLLEGSGFRCEIYYLNMSAKQTFARRVGVQSIHFGSVFLFRNGFRVYPIGDQNNDWFGFDRRKQQGYARFLGTRDIIGRVDINGSNEDFQEASSRNQGLIETEAVTTLKQAVMDHGLKRLEKYIVPVTWADSADKKTEDISRLLTDPGKARVSAAVANLVDNDEVELLDYSKRLIDLINERSADFEKSLVSLKAIAQKTGDRTLLGQLSRAEKRFEDLRKSEAEAREIADRERAAAEAAAAEAEAAKAEAEQAKSQADTERRRSHFLESIVTLDTSTIINLHHQVTIYAVDVAQQIENLLSETSGQKSVPREIMLKAVEQMAYLNRKILAVTRFAAKAKFQLDSEKIETDFPAFLAEYIQQAAQTSGSRTRIEVSNTHPGMTLRFNPIDASIVIDNLISNAKRARASRISFDLSPLDKSGLQIRITDNGRGISPSADKKRIFEMGYTTTHGSGLGLYHVRQVLGEINGTIELEDSAEGRGTTFLMKIALGRKTK
ncbi:sensor histidine kinase [Bradyrhizobium lupini]